MRAGLKARVAAGAAIFRDDQILLLHRSPLAANPGAWDLPGGPVAPRETLPRALRREVRDETGFVVRAGPMFHAEVFGSFSKKGKIRPTIGVYFLCQSPGHKPPRLDPKTHTEFAWVRASELNDYPTVPHLARTVRAAFVTRGIGFQPRKELERRALFPTLGPHAVLPVPA